MSSTLTWEPANRSKEMLPDKLKYVLQKAFDGTVSTTMNESDLAYLRGLRDAGVEGAEVLISAINKYGKITVKEEF